MSLDINDLLTIGEVAALKEVSRRTVHSWIERGIAPASIRIGDRTFFDRTAAESFKKPTRGAKCKSPAA
jgi:predicted DNA-binding transcriptional regulator AlpA